MGSLLCPLFHAPHPSSEVLHHLRTVALVVTSLLGSIDTVVPPLGMVYVGMILPLLGIVDTIVSLLLVLVLRNADRFLFQESTVLEYSYCNHIVVLLLPC